MTIVAKNPLTKRRVSAVLLIIVTVLAIAVPTALYWALQRTDLHSRWQLQADYASQFSFQMDDAAALMNGTIWKWNNVTSSFAGNEMGSANENLSYLSEYDTAHANQLIMINYAIENIRPPFNTIPFTNISYAQRTILAAQLRSIANKILYAYWNFLNYTSVGGTAGPPFWYSGPSPPDESLLQAAVNVALTLQRPS